ncbi:regulatory protein, luxR family [Streptomyces sp. yr375]|uniref:AAA family ATPase n=1 Tax=Streptomyces sp. yr375 TaxID=1761906 RepID=UPI0008C6B94E|nr:LuxR family transcriptional regulator [Streptomyces sp. yr375]SES27381.1 regulatory protein, luxR family [Streptomyces sp. yr375]
MSMSLIERDESVDLLTGLLSDAMAGRGRTVLVGGAVAVGKSALLEAVADAAATAGALVLVAAASEAETPMSLGVMGQLLCNAPLTAEERANVDRLLDVAADGGPGARQLPMDPRDAHTVCAVLLALSARQPLAIVVDDVHHADQASLTCLSHLVRRMHTARIMAAFGHAEQAPYRHTGFRLELLRRPGNRILQVPLLTGCGVRAMTADRLGAEDADRLAADCHAVSGGNPLLLEALLTGHQAALRTVAPGGAARGCSAELVVADGYGHAVVSCLRRSGSRALTVARGLAVLGSPDGVDRLLGLDPGNVDETLRDLMAAGLLDAGTFRHRVARSAVLTDMDSSQRTELHGRAAELTHAEGALATVVADHLVAASHPGAPWTVPVLERAAELALSEGLTEGAVEYLRLACRTCADERRLSRLKTALVQAEWCVNPSAPTPYLADLADAQRRGHLRAGDAVVLARALLWHGRFAAAKDVLLRLGRSGAPQDSETAHELRIARSWLRCTYPPVLECLPRAEPEPHRQDLPSLAVDQRLEAAGTLDSVLGAEPSTQAWSQAERVLSRTRLGETGMDTVESALLALTYGQRLDRAALRCDGLLDEAVVRRSPGRQARLLAIRAEIALRQGDLPGAERNARQALRVLPAGGWGVTVGSPLASLLMALTAMGAYEDAARQLALPVPETMMQSRHGLHYLRARGRYHLCTGQPDAALRDFRACGELMGRWGLDVPGLIAWRNESAEALLLQSRPDEARQLLEEQLDRCGPTTTRERGAALRILAGTVPVRRRPLLLRKAADALQGTGDRYELARALTDLTRAYVDLGELRLARLVGRRTWDLVEQCRARPLALVLGTGLGRIGPGTDEDPAPTESGQMLSEAEQRVVELAAHGYTNREIAKRLYVTVSTVEQHLTHAYRKLNVTRAELPSVLASLTS